MPPRRSLRALVPLLALVGCATTGGSRLDAPARNVPADLRGDLVAMLPANPLMWVDFDLASARRSAHFDGVLSLATELGADLAMVRRELGFDWTRQADRLAFAIYAPPGEGAQQGWPLLVARGRFVRSEVLAEARTRVPGEAPSERSEGGILFTVLGQRAYAFPVEGVMLVMERGLLRRVAQRLSGEARESASDDRRFAGLWLAAEGEGNVRVAVDLAGIRARQRVDVRRAPQAGLVDRFVGRALLTDAATLRAAGECHDARGATVVSEAVTAEARRYGGNLAVRLFGMSRLMNEGVQARAEGDMAVVRIDATRDEARRLLRVASLVRELTEAED